MTLPLSHVGQSLQPIQGNATTGEPSVSPVDVIDIALDLSTISIATPSLVKMDEARRVRNYQITKLDAVLADA